MTITLTYEQALEGLERAIAEKPEGYRDPDSGPGINCRNWKSDGAPSCIIGHIMSYYGATSDSIGEGGVQFLVGNRELKVDEKTLILLSGAQGQQDNGKSWREAVDIAKERAEQVA